MTFDVPEACLLPTADQPLRVAEFDTLFATALRSVERLSATHARLTLDGAAEATVRDLTARESECCSFFTFTITPSGGDVLLDIVVPPAQATVLAALVSR